MDKSRVAICPCGGEGWFDNNRYRKNDVSPIYLCSKCHKHFTSAADRVINSVSAECRSFISLLNEYTGSSGNGISLLMNEHVTRGSISKYFKKPIESSVLVRTLPYKIGFDDAHLFVEEKTKSGALVNNKGQNLKWNPENWAATFTDEIPNLSLALFCGTIILEKRDEWDNLVRDFMSKIEDPRLINLLEMADNSNDIKRIENGHKNVNYFLKRILEFNRLEGELGDKRNENSSEKEDWYGFVIDLADGQKVVLMFKPKIKPSKFKSIPYVVLNRKEREKPHTREINYPWPRQSPGEARKKTIYYHKTKIGKSAYKFRQLQNAAKKNI